MFKKKLFLTYTILFILHASSLPSVYAYDDNSDIFGTIDKWNGDSKNIWCSENLEYIYHEAGQLKIGVGPIGSGSHRKAMVGFYHFDSNGNFIERADAQSFYIGATLKKGSTRHVRMDYNSDGSLTKGESINITISPDRTVGGPKEFVNLSKENCNAQVGDSFFFNAKDGMRCVENTQSDAKRAFIIYSRSKYSNHNLEIDYNTPFKIGHETSIVFNGFKVNLPEPIIGSIEVDHADTGSLGKNGDSVKSIVVEFEYGDYDFLLSKKYSPESPIIAEVTDKINSQSYSATCNQEELNVYFSPLRIGVMRRLLDVSVDPSDY